MLHNAALRKVDVLCAMNFTAETWRLITLEHQLQLFCKVRFSSCPRRQQW
jgi:hypothetical protein